MERTQFAVLHVSKFKLGSGAIGAHIDRKHTPPNANPKMSKHNKEFISFPIGESLNQSIDRRIKQGYTSKRKIRQDAVKAVGLILTGSHNRMHELVNNGKLDEWVEENKKWVSEKFGAENIVRFTLHMDEKTPHIHCVFTPITPDGRLHYKHFIDGKAQMRDLHTNYAKKMRKFGLYRGEELTNKNRNYKDVKRWYKRKGKAMDEVMQENNEWRELSKSLISNNTKLEQFDQMAKDLQNAKDKIKEEQNKKQEYIDKNKRNYQFAIDVLKLSYNANKGDLKAKQQLDKTLLHYEQKYVKKQPKNNLKTNDKDLER